MDSIYGYDFSTPSAAMDSTSLANSREKETKTNNSFSMNDFYKLFATQLQNQDMMNPVDDGQFLAQMSQMAMIQAVDQMNTMTMTSYAFGFMGKEVIVAEYDTLGNMVSKQGLVDKVILYNGTPQLYVNGNPYGVDQVMEVFSGVKNDETEQPDGDTDLPSDEVTEIEENSEY